MAKKNHNSSPVAEKLKMFFNHYVIKSILILIFAGLFMFYGTLVVLRHYTHHGEALSVPDVRGMTLREAENLLQSKKMRWQLSDSVYVSSVMPGTVFIQSPEPGSKVKENRNIFLTVNSLAPEKVKMPNVVDLSYRQAKTSLETNGLNIGQITHVHYIAKDYVMKQMYQGEEIRSGTEIIKGSEIDLVLGIGLSDERTPVPNLMGTVFFEARDSLTKYYLNFGVIIYDQTVITSTDSVNAFIYRQRPASNVNATLQLGSSIDVWMSVDETKRPDAIQEKESE